MMMILMIIMMMMMMIIRQVGPGYYKRVVSLYKDIQLLIFFCIFATTQYTTILYMVAPGPYLTSGFRPPALRMVARNIIAILTMTMSHVLADL